MSKPALARGTRDYSPADMSRRQYVFNILESLFKKYGFQPLETPAVENLDTLTGKYGEEGDRLIFKILNSGHYLEHVSIEDFNQALATQSKSFTGKIAEKALRYDLTIPFARYVAMNHGQLSFPFRRYQMQPVWRADRPQKGRYREFYQCDADIIGSQSVLMEADLVALYNEGFKLLGFNDFSIYVNHRMVLQGLAASVGCTDNQQFIRFVTTLDKWDKIGKEKVAEEWSSWLTNQTGIEAVIDLLEQEEVSIETLLDFFRQNGVLNDLISQGFAELKELLLYCQDIASLKFNLKLARGLDYYTGCVFEVVTHEMQMGSLGGGGRYANLTGVFGLKDMSGVGISFGFERIIDVMSQLNLFPESLTSAAEILVIPIDESIRNEAFQLLKQIRQVGISADMYPEVVKFKKSMSYAEKRGTHYVVLLGKTEVEQGVFQLKNLTTGNQVTINMEQVSAIKAHL